MSVVPKRKKAFRSRANRSRARGRGLLVTAVGVLVALALVAMARTARAAEGTSIAVLTMGPGDPTFSKFGHDAIVVRTEGERARVYNFGTFSFQSKTLFSDFLKGRLRYWLSTATLEGTMRGYKRQNRSLLLQELELEPAAAEELARALEENAEPENKYYLYDHFRDNCATRVRDAIDRASGGSVRRALERPAEATYRDHALRLVADDWPLYIGLDLGLGPAVDVPITEWDEGFLPERLAEGLRKVRVRGANGEVPLVRREDVAFEAAREPARERAPLRAPWFLAIGVLSGILGALLVFLWSATNNDVAHRNANAFLSPAVALALVPAGIALALGRSSAKRFVARTLSACAALSVIGVVFALVVGHDVARTASLFVPLWVLAWAGLRFAPPRAAAPRASG
jgi:hypothetical protein